MRQLEKSVTEGESSKVQPQTVVLPPGYFDFYDDGDEISLLSYVNVLLRRRWTIIGIVLVSVLSAYAFSKLQTPRYEASATFLVAENRSTQVLTDEEGLAFALKNPFDYFKQIAISSPILDQMVRKQFTDPQTGVAATLPEIWQIEGETAQERLLATRARLKDSINLSYERTFPNIITLKVASSSPELCADMANHLIELLREYDLNLKTSSAQDRISFIQNQLESTEKQLGAAEGKLEEFMKRNKGVRADQVEIEKGRLEREVDLQGEIYKTLKKELEIARITEKENASAISIIDRAEPPRVRSSPRTMLNVALAGVVGLMLGVGLVFVMEFLFSASGETEEGREFRRILGDIRNDFRRMLFLRNKA